MNARCKHGAETPTTLPLRHRSLCPSRSPPLYRNSIEKRVAGCDAVESRRNCARRYRPSNLHCKREAEPRTTLPQRHHSLHPPPSPSAPAPAPQHATRDRSPRDANLSKIGGVARCGWCDSIGVAILYRLAASVVLGSRQIRQSRNCLPEISNLNVPVLHSKSSGQNAKSARRAKLA